ncbi:MAG: selenite/tellurite reduction operon c-type cytochrome ExtM [Syntrophales bacterium]
MSRPLNYLYVPICCLLLMLHAGCSTCSGERTTCETCHRGIEMASASHSGCVSCHGGDPRANDKEASHRAMLGPKNPSAPDHWEKSCGACHPYHLGRMRANLMFTNTGMIKNIQSTWEGENGLRYAGRGDRVFDAAGNERKLQPVAELDHLAGELYRKFCSLCHVGIESADGRGAGHAAGCAACHFPYNESATYEGDDPTVKGKFSYSASHRMERLPGNQVCLRCHNRSGRISLSYQGLNDGNNSLVPTQNGLPGPMMISGGRNVTHITPDVHFAAGMDCIDCHTSRDVMGDGYAYENMYLQTEISCEDCHGGNRAPRYREITRENEEALRESKRYSLQMRPGMKMILTAKDRPYSNVFYRDGIVFVLGKRSGKLFQSKVITGTPEHTVVGHERMECTACHSRTVAQCYGCHTQYDKRKAGIDYIKDEVTPGRFSETEDYRMLYPFPLALNQRGKVSPVTPGCQTFVTVIEADGYVSKNEYVATYKGKRQVRFAPFYSHNTGKQAVGCGECHGNPAFLGFGQHVVEGDTVTATLLCEKSTDKPLDGFLTLQRGTVKAFSAVTREGSRPLNGREVKKILAVNLCLVCHGSAKDPIYRKELDYRALDDLLHRRLLSGPVR